MAENKLTVLATLIITATIVAGTPAMGQERSRTAHIVLIARMPETLTFGVNSAGWPESFADARPPVGPQIARNITLSWTLAMGRDQVVTWTHIQRQEPPVLLAFAMPADRIAGDLPGFHLRAHPTAASSRLDSLAITDSNRATSRTVSLSDSLDPAPAEQLLDDAYIGTMKIQVQALP